MKHRFFLLVGFLLLVGFIMMSCKDDEPKEELTPEQILEEKLIGEWLQVLHGNDSKEQIHKYKPIHFVVFTENSIFYYHAWEGEEPVPWEVRDLKISMDYQIIAADSIRLFKCDDYAYYYGSDSPSETEHNIIFHNADSISIQHFMPMFGGLAVPYPENHSDIYLIRKK